MTSIKKIYFILVLLFVFTMFQTVQAVPSNYRQYPTSSPLITLVDQHELNVNYYHENFYIRTRNLVPFYSLIYLVMVQKISSWKPIFQPLAKQSICHMKI